ncbi:MAG: sulfurtransferase-like selenium metabolism protein YedF [Bacteroidetes bacterium]|uniref:Sulfurtransferase-like selenium metabolism protein YedF n=1 Tax=Candidatus Pullibacteroides excrementavium TaxID=2840905 RepID=A0A9D9H158_9BACT|nr:sulfurtransferase-like selenium metabolism protein YedF [Candidatus Pullibacteroides excrementavium]
MATIDVRGLACPAPLIKTKQALDKAEAGSTLQIVGNGEIPFGNLKNYLKELGIAYKETRVDEEWILAFTVPEKKKEGVVAENFCSVNPEAAEPGNGTGDTAENGTKNAAAAKAQAMPETRNNGMPGINITAHLNTPLPYMVVIKSLHMGQGEEALGTLLMKSYVNVLPELDYLPQVICLYNEGVKLAIEGSPVLESLQKLESKGVKIIVCGTCTEYYKVSGQLKAGSISNMYHIASLLSTMPKVVYP